MSIIEKLGITPGPWTPFNLKVRSKLSNMESIETEENRYRSYYPVVTWDTEEGIDIHTTQLNVILAAPEMLEALIDDAYYHEKIYADRENEVFVRHVQIIEKATGKTWEEIKALYDQKN